MNSKRLSKLADSLETIPAHKFNMDMWENTTECGTVRCAGGWACLIPAFNRAGLVFNEFGSPSINSNKNLTAFEALSYFFDIDLCQSENIFSSEGYRHTHPKVGTVIKKIRRFAETGSLAKL